MRRLRTQPRANWQQKVEETGLTYHTVDGAVYWDESAYYRLTTKEVDILEAAGNALHELYVQGAQHVIDRNWFAELSIPEAAIPSIVQSWDNDDFSLYGRFDLAFDGRQPPKLLEYNADTPTALVEAAVTQWYWLQDLDPKSDQFNSIHEHLVTAWKSLKANRDETVYMGGVKDHLEDAQTVLYLQDTCFQAGVRVEQLFIEDLGFHPMRRRFVDLREGTVTTYFKLYPWEWMWHEAFGEHLKLGVCRFIEPVWKMLFSNKGMLPILWELFPNHPNLMPAFFHREECASRTGGNFVSKPKLSREGANVQIRQAGQVVCSTEGEYGEEGLVHQEFFPIPDHDGNRPVMGVWMIQGEACGLGIREDTGLVTGNTSRFIPHLFG